MPEQDRFRGISREAQRYPSQADLQEQLRHLHEGIMRLGGAFKEKKLFSREVQDPRLMPTVHYLRKTLRTIRRHLRKQGDALFLKAQQTVLHPQEIEHMQSTLDAANALARSGEKVFDSAERGEGVAPFIRAVTPFFSLRLKHCQSIAASLSKEHGSHTTTRSGHASRASDRALQAVALGIDSVHELESISSEAEGEKADEALAKLNTCLGSMREVEANYRKTTAYL